MPYLEGMPVPEPHIDYNEFWDGCRRHVLLIRKCRDCGWYNHYPRPLCPQCLSWNVKWSPVSGKGSVWSWTIIRKSMHPDLIDRSPYNIVEIELIEQEGLRLISNLIGDNEEDIYIGLPVECVFEEISPEITLPRFKRMASTR